MKAGLLIAIESLNEYVGRDIKVKSLTKDAFNYFALWFGHNCRDDLKS